VNPIIPKQMEAIPIALRIIALYPLSQLLLAGHYTCADAGVYAARHPRGSPAFSGGQNDIVGLRLDEFSVDGDGNIITHQ
jgi:hypothetical protein